MKTAGRVATHSRLPQILFDIFLFLSAVIFLTAGEPFLSDSLKMKIGSHPAIHRAALAVLCAVVLVVYKYYQIRVLSGKWPQSRLISFFKVIPVSPQAWTWGVFVLFSVTMTYSSWLRHIIFHTSFDMAIFVQAVWNTLHGHFLFSSIKGNICLLGDHFSPVLLAFAIPYAIWPDPKCLLLIQALAASACVFPIFKLARKKTGSEWLGLLFVIAFVLYQPVRNSVRFDFHPEMIAMPFLFWGFYYQERGKLLPASLCYALVLMTKESAALVVFIFSLYEFLFRKNKTFAAFWIAGALIYFYLVINMAIPHFSKTDYFYLSGNFLGWKEEGFRALLSHIFSLSSLSYLVKIFLPLGLLSFADPAALILTLPILLQNITSRNEAVRSIFFHYTIYLTPAVFISAIYGFSALRRSNLIPQKVKQNLGFYLLGCSLLMTGIQEYYVIREFQLQNTPHLREISEGIKMIPNFASVRTHEMFAAHLAHREKVYILENTNPREGGSAEAQTADYVVLDRMLSGEDFVPALQARAYAVVLASDGFYILKRTEA